MWRDCIKCKKEFLSTGPMDMECPSCLRTDANENRRYWEENKAEYSYEPNYPGSTSTGKSVSSFSNLRISTENPKDKKIKELEEQIAKLKADEEWHKKCFEDEGLRWPAKTEDKSTQTEALTQEKETQTEAVMEIKPK